MAQPFVIYKGNLSPPALYTFTVQGVPYVLTGCTVTFSMRPVGSALPTISHAAATIVDPIAGTAQYVWAGTDTALAGQYAGWFTLTLANGKQQDTPEFEVWVADHTTAGAGALVSYEEQIDAMRIGNMLRPVTDNDEQLIRSLIVTASALAEERTGHRFTLETAVAKVYNYDGSTVLDLGPYDLRALTSVQLDTDTSAFLLDPSQYRLEPRNLPNGIYTHLILAPYAVGEGGSSLNFWGGTWREFGRQVTVTGDWGWAIVPEPIRQGVKVLVARWFNNPLALQTIESAQSKMQFSRGGSGGIGGKTSTGDDLPDEVMSLWRPYMRAGAG